MAHNQIKPLDFVSFSSLLQLTIQDSYNNLVELFDSLSNFDDRDNKVSKLYLNLKIQEIIYVKLLLIFNFVNQNKTVIDKLVNISTVLSDFNSKYFQTIKNLLQYSEYIDRHFVHLYDIPTALTLLLKNKVHDNSAILPISVTKSLLENTKKTYDENKNKVHDDSAILPISVTKSLLKNKKEIYNRLNRIIKATLLKFYSNINNDIFKFNSVSNGVLNATITMPNTYSQFIIELTIRMANKRILAWVLLSITPSFSFPYNLISETQNNAHLSNIINNINSMLLDSDNDNDSFDKIFKVISKYYCCFYVIDILYAQLKKIENNLFIMLSVDLNNILYKIGNLQINFWKYYYLSILFNPETYTLSFDIFQKKDIKNSFILSFKPNLQECISLISIIQYGIIKLCEHNMSQIHKNIKINHIEDFEITQEYQNFHLNNAEFNPKLYPLEFNDRFLIGYKFTYYNYSIIIIININSGKYQLICNNSNSFLEKICLWCENQLNNNSNFEIINSLLLIIKLYIIFSKFQSEIGNNDIVITDFIPFSSYFNNTFFSLDCDLINSDIETYISNKKNLHSLYIPLPYFTNFFLVFRFITNSITNCIEDPKIYLLGCISNEFGRLIPRSFTGIKYPEFAIDNKEWAYLDNFENSQYQVTNNSIPLNDFISFTSDVFCSNIISSSFYQHIAYELITVRLKALNIDFTLDKQTFKFESPVSFTVSSQPVLIHLSLIQTNNIKFYFQVEIIHDIFSNVIAWIPEQVDNNVLNYHFNSKTNDSNCLKLMYSSLNDIILKNFLQKELTIILKLTEFLQSSLFINSNFPLNFFVIKQVSFSERRILISFDDDKQNIEIKYNFNSLQNAPNFTLTVSPFSYPFLEIIENDFSISFFTFLLSYLYKWHSILPYIYRCTSHINSINQDLHISLPIVYAPHGYNSLAIYYLYDLSFPLLISTTETSEKFHENLSSSRFYYTNFTQIFDAWLNRIGINRQIKELNRLNPKYKENLEKSECSLEIFEYPLPDNLIPSFFSYNCYFQIKRFQDSRIPKTVSNYFSSLIISPPYYPFSLFNFISCLAFPTPIFIDLIEIMQLELDSFSNSKDFDKKKLKIHILHQEEKWNWILLRGTFYCFIYFSFYSVNNIISVILPFSWLLSSTQVTLWKFINGQRVRILDKPECLWSDSKLSDVVKILQQKDISVLKQYESFCF